MQKWLILIFLKTADLGSLPCGSFFISPKSAPPRNLQSDRSPVRCALCGVLANIFVWIKNVLSCFPKEECQSFSRNLKRNIKIDLLISQKYGSRYDYRELLLTEKFSELYGLSWRCISGQDCGDTSSDFWLEMGLRQLSKQSLKCLHTRTLAAQLRLHNEHFWCRASADSVSSDALLLKLRINNSRLT